METMPVLKGTNLCWVHLSSTKCTKYRNLGHISLSCSVGGKNSSGELACRILSEDDKSRLASIYARCFASISCPVFFGGVSWANIVGGSSFSSLPVCNDLASSGSSSEMKPTLMVFVKLNDRFATLEHSLASLVECVDKLAKRLNSPRPIVSQPSPGCQPLVTPLSQNQGVDIVISEGSSVATGGETIAGVAVFDSSVISKLEETLNNLSVTVMGLLAKIDNAGLVPAKDIVCWHMNSENMVSIITETKLKSNIRPWIMNKFDGVRIFSSGLDKEFLGAGVAIIINNSLACYVSKVEKISSHLVFIQFFFKDKLSVVILGLYADASAETRFGQACKINCIIAKAANSSTFVVLGGNFNENGSKKSASFKFCSNLGLVNSFNRHSLVKASTWTNFRGSMKVIDYIFVSKNLLSILAGHEVAPVSEFFDTDYNAVLVSIGLGGLLNAQLNGECKQANKNKWKFKIKDADDSK
ncbi:hypothetical protein G9A89_003095 [Geosiphon pyriformis]|nr:hypothetical protein G9A89_003095 [Geosiphon pyriformis]